MRRSQEKALFFPLPHSVSVYPEVTRGVGDRVSTSIFDYLKNAESKLLLDFSAVLKAVAADGIAIFSTREEKTLCACAKRVV